MGSNGMRWVCFLLLRGLGDPAGDVVDDDDDGAVGKGGDEDEMEDKEFVE